MKVQSKGTNEIKVLTLTDPKSGVDYVQDFVGNWGALLDGQFTRIKGTDLYEAEADTLDWWVEVLAVRQALEERIAELKEKCGSEAVSEVLNTINVNDLEEETALMNAALDETFEVSEGN